MNQPPHGLRDLSTSALYGTGTFLPTFSPPYTPITTSDHGLVALVGAAEGTTYDVNVSKETIADAIKKITPSLVILGVVTGITIALGSTIVQLGVKKLSK